MLATAVFIVAARRYWELRCPWDEPHILAICSATMGMVIIIAGNEMTVSPPGDHERLTKDPNWMTRRIYTYQSDSMPIVGGLLLIGGTIALYRL